ncbi:MAG: hypothetical protein Q9169_002512 [Polycauliona sp. 2 TL-2023]
MNIDREDSPTTVLGDKSPRLTSFSPSENMHVIDLEASHGFQGLDANDYLTDKQFEERFLLNSPHRHGGPQSRVPQPVGLMPVETFSANGNTYRRGETIELHNGEFLRVVNILEDRHTGEGLLQGYGLQRLSQCQRLFDQHLNELTMVIKEDNVNIQTNEDGAIKTVSYLEVLRIRDVILTNAAFPSFSCREDPANSTKPRDFLRDQGRLVCRWKMKISNRPHPKEQRWMETSVQRLSAGEADLKFRLDGEHLRRKWRGITIKMGSCPSWLQGEKEFDLRERNPQQDMPSAGESEGLGYRSKRYTFGDAFCGAGGCSRGAKLAGLRVAWGFDFDPAAIDSYAKNFFGARCEATPADIFVSVLDDDFCVDVLHLSPPCQPYSPAHTRSGRNDEMNEATFFAGGEIIKKSKPRVVTLENTFGLAQRWPEWMDALVRFFTALGFSVRWRVLNLAYYGCPQARKRLVVMAACPGETLPGFPPPTHGPGLLPLATVNDAIQRIPRGCPNHDPSGAPRRNLFPYNADLPLKNCITTGRSLDTHPSGRRGITDRELACLQSFPLWHKFGRIGVKKQIGNAVPPVFAEILLSHIRRCLEEADGPVMATEQSFKDLKSEVSAALVKATKTAGQISSEDLAFQRSINPELDRSLNRHNKRLLSLVRSLNKTATAGSETIPPPLHDVESVDDGWRGIVDIVDNLLEKADACLDEFTGVVKKLTPGHENKLPTAPPKKPLSKREYRYQNIPKPQRLFKKVPTNDETAPFKPLLDSKPNATVPLEKSLVSATAQDGTIHYNHPYEQEIIESTYPDSAYVKDDPIMYQPFESTTATWVDTPEAVQDMLGDLKNAKEIAVDLEHHDVHSYIGLVSLMQISTRERDWIVDTLVPWREDLQILNEVFTDPRIIKVLHGSNSDIVWLQRDLGLYVVGLFDTYHASRLLGYPKHGLAYLLHRFANYETDKRYQMADWRMRPLPEQMYDYARSDTHFLLYIFDNLRNELLTKSGLADSKGSLIDDVRDSSKGEALQRYERQSYDKTTGSGLFGWYSMLGRSSSRFNREQFAVFRAIHEWRDKSARLEDESLFHILSNQSLFAIAREMPPRLPDLLGYCHPISPIMKKAAPELLGVIQKARAASVNGPEMKEAMKPRGHAHMQYGTKLAGTPLAVNHMPEANPIASVSGNPRKNSLAALLKSQFWGSTIGGGFMGDLKPPSFNESKGPCLAIPLPPLTAEVFENPGSKVSSRPVHAITDPGTLAEHEYTKKRKPREDEVFIVKEAGSSKRQKLSGVQRDSLLASEGAVGKSDHLDGEMEQMEIPLHEAEINPEAEEKSRHKRERRLEKKKLRQQRKEEKLKETIVDGNGRIENEGSEAFDYENAPSVLHARQERDRGGKVTKGIDPYAKSLNAPKGMRKVQKEGPGRSITYKG